MNMGAVLSSQAPYGLEGMQQAGSPALNIHQRHQSLQYLPQPAARASPRLQDVREDEEEEEDRAGKMPAKTLEAAAAAARNADSLQAEIDDAEYHLEEQLRNELEHEDYNPHAPVDASRDAHQASSAGFTPAEHFANEPGNNLVLHHPRPHSRGHSLSKSFFRDQVQDAVENAGHQQFGSLKNIPESRLVDDHCEIETNPSNLGTPLNMDFPAAFHNKTLSTVSNPWQDAVSANGSARHSSHGSKQSSKFNVDAPVFKFNPTSSFTPGFLNFSNSSNHQHHNGGFHDSHNSVIDANPFASASAPPPSKINAAAPAFAPGQGDFNFSAPGGLKFRPDAPSFTPLGAHTAAAGPSPLGPRHDPVSRGTKSLSGDLDLDDDNDSPLKEPRAVVRRSSTQSTLPGAFQEDNDLDGFDVFEGSRAKRAKSVALDGDEIPLFAERPEPDSLETVDEDTVKETRSEPDDEGDQARRTESSFSSTSLDQLDTQMTTAAPSEASPANRTEQKWNPRDSQSNIESPSEKRPLGEDTFKSSASVCASAPACDEPESAQPPAASPPKRAETTPARRKLIPKGLSSSHFASPPAKPLGLAGSRFARSPSPIVPAEDEIIESVEREFERDNSSEEREIPEQTFEEIDAVMQHFENDPSKGINKVDAFKWADAEPTDLPSEDLQPLLRDARSTTPRGYDDVADVAAQPLPTTELEDPFLDPPIDLQESRQANRFDDRGSDSEMDCDWEGTFPENEHSKLQTRAQFFDTRVNDLVGDILASRLEPLAKTLFSIHHSLASKGSQRGSSSRRDMRSASTEYQESDADDEDDEPPPRRSISPKRDRRLEQIRLAVTEALASQQRGHPALNLPEAGSGIEESAVLKTLVEIKEQLVTRSVAHDVASQTFTEHSSVSRADDWAIKAIGLEQRLQFEQDKLEREIQERRSAEDTAAELTRKLHAAESRVEAEVIHRSVFDKRVADLEDRLRSQEEQTEEEIKSRHAAEDRLSEVQRLLRFSSDEETRLSMVLEEKDHRIKSLEQSGRDMAVKVATLESARDEWTRTSSEMNSRVHLLEADLRAVRQDNNNWRAEAERAGETARRKTGELAHTVDENKRLQKSLDNVVSQLEENERLRESWRAKFLSLQEDMGKAAREVAEENARFIKRDQAMLARKEVMEARLHAEAKTRERLEIEMERLQDNERAAMRAVNESKRLEEMLADLRTENAKLQQSVCKYQREFEEARESGASEVKRTRMTLQTEVDAANNQVNVIREELEEQNIKLRAEVGSLKSQHEAEVEELKRKHLNEAEELRVRWERQLTIAVEDGHRTEQHLRERLSLSLSKTEHFQDRIMHLEDKLEITRQAAAAAAQAAKQAGVEAGAISVASKAISLLPEKVSPQALRESILVLQEQLQSREQRVEELEQTLAGLDPDAANKISKRDDEISWLRELLSVRHGDLQDIITALSQEDVDRVAIKDATIRLKANLQMEEQERERAMNGGSAISLPNIAQTLQAATPRVAQTIAPIAAAWGNWRKTGNTPSFRSLSGVLSGATLAAPSLSAPAVAARTATPAKSRITSTQQSSTVSGLLTPPASGLRQPSSVDERPQPTAFSSTGRRYPMVSSSFERRTRRDSDASRLSPQRSSSETPFRRSDFKEDPMTPPMMHQSIYDEDARPGNFDEHDFFEEED
ncbi:hypothetical protein ESCO_002357 [Escovopsis weberi]|uniref:Uncharacterized protein n=1 Tax=Escovopsis weberi TaxID=150374 RepID=A0A0M9VWW4_ESCWE|nr:hypothetical protein ESCO_002357 [Escovopsis weberi]